MSITEALPCFEARRIRRRAANRRSTSCSRRTTRTDARHFAELRDAFEHHGEIIEYCVETSKSTRDVGPRAKGLW